MHAPAEVVKAGLRPIEVGVGQAAAAAEVAGQFDQQQADGGEARRHAERADELGRVEAVHRPAEEGEQRRPGEGEHDGEPEGVERGAEADAAAFRGFFAEFAQAAPRGTLRDEENDDAEDEEGELARLLVGGLSDGVAGVVPTARGEAPAGGVDQRSEIARDSGGQLRIQRTRSAMNAA